MVRWLFLSGFMIICAIYMPAHAEMIYFNIGGDAVMASPSFTSQMAVLSTGATEDDPDVTTRYALDWVYDKNSGGFIYAGLGFTIQNHAAIEIEGKLGEVKYLDSTQVFTSDVIINEKILTARMMGFMVNILGFFDNGLNSIFFGGLGLGYMTITNGININAENNPANNTADNTVPTYNKRLFAVDSNQLIAQGFLGIQFKMTENLGISFRIISMAVPSYGLTRIKPYSETTTTVIEGGDEEGGGDEEDGGDNPITDGNTFKPNEPIQYEVYGLKYSSTAFGISIRISL